MILASLACCTCTAQQTSSVTAAPNTSLAAVTDPVATVGVATDALILLAQYQAAVGGVDLTTLQGTGTIRLPGSTVPLPASLVILGSSFLRIKISNADRLTGFAARGQLYKSYYVDGTTAIDAMGTGPASISAFQLLSTKDVMSKLLSLSKDTATDATGKKYDRLRARHAFFVPAGGKLTSAAKTAAVDYYFDPSTHYLIKSVTTVQVTGILNPIPIETSYSDYRMAGLSRVPFKISLVLNGQPDWILTLTDVKLSTTLDPSRTAF